MRRLVDAGAVPRVYTQCVRYVAVVVGAGAEAVRRPLWQLACRKQLPSDRPEMAVEDPAGGSWVWG